MIEHVLATHAGVVCVFVTFNIYIQTFCRDLATVFDRIDDSLERNDQLGVKRLNIDAIEFLIKIDEYWKCIKPSSDPIMTFQFLFSVFRSAKSILGGTIFVQILTNGALLAGSILQIDLCGGQWSPQLFYGSYSIMLAVGNAIFFCYFATITSHHLRMMSARIYASKWYNMKNVRQKETLMMIVFAQLARNLDGLGIFHCNMETFARVYRLQTAYFVHFKRFSNYFSR